MAGREAGGRGVGRSPCSSRRYYRNIYLGKDSYFGIPRPRNRYRKALYNLAAQAIDFADGYTVDHRGRRVRFVFG